MIAVIYGTTGELIKLAPLMAALEAEGQLLSLCTAQQATQIEPMLQEFALPAPDLWMGRGHKGRDLDSARQVPGWAVGVLWSAVTKARSLLKRRASLVVVHGDTFTTVLGAFAGRIAGLPVAHVEAGLRSGDWRNPFPEELNRRVTSKLAGIHFTPGQWAANNLVTAGVKGEIVDIGANTVRDSLAMIAGRTPAPAGLPDAPFGIVSIHRFELLRDQRALRAALVALARGSEKHPLLFIDHPVTIAAVREAGLDEILSTPGIQRIPRQSYASFLGLMNQSSFLISDSGGSQEECAALGLPCLIHRARTERLDGLGDTVTLTRMDVAALDAFLADPPERAQRAADVTSPTHEIVAFLRRYAFLRRGGSA